MSYCLAYMTAASVEEAKTIGRALVGEKLAACVNLIPGMVSVYRWEGALEGGRGGRADRQDAGGEVRRPGQAGWRRSTPTTRRARSGSTFRAACPPFLDWIAGETG